MLPRFSRLTVLLASFAAALVTTAATSSAEPSPVVHTAQGAVRGTASTDYRAFQGIPFAQPPVGDLRWQPPQPPSSWYGVRDATQPPPACEQPGNGTMSEDCLYLNVYTPADANPASRKPVAVWIYGGAFRSGSSAQYQPVQMVDQGDMLVVTLNYRVGAMGFLTTPQLDTDNGTPSGDYGLLDQIQALHWVQDNIARFGGDPHRVMIAGQSAGGESVCMLLASPKAAGLFSSAVVESGLTCGQNTRTAAQATNAAFITTLGCDGPDVIACLRRKTPGEILAAQGTSGVWYPVVGTTALPVQPPDAFASGQFNHVPVLIGNTAHEGAFFIYQANDVAGKPVSADAYTASVQATFGDRAPDVLARYPLQNYTAPGAAEAALKTDIGFSCATLTNAAALTARVPTYVYEFRDETAPYHASVPPSFSLADEHSAELPYLWGTDVTPTLTSTQQKLSHDMIAYWAQFARTATLPAPRYNPSAPREIVFNADGPAIVNDMAADHQCSYWNQVYPDGWPFHFNLR
ncbi:carboxylesterase family protein [Amycolatopsis acidicola]|uniref:Carboxylic ester hydrolase n=1 Tax=Amycolatopsis acidicola TaxID=2596893 RepID=A0A5N0V6V6_9PSEU|nr:carboxylesterase family protein [Amycolatopsis acidicola]KAA9160761.1 carboxylesterase family protein [Amycolatopsis acidicola]